MKYKIVSADNYDGLAFAVNKEIEKGWIPLGGVAILNEMHTDEVWAQAMITNADVGAVYFYSGMYTKPQVHEKGL
jgi:hypothetical protein